LLDAEIAQGRETCGLFFVVLDNQRRLATFFLVARQEEAAQRPRDRLQRTLRRHT
jgi:hypothetical protein